MVIDNGHKENIPVGMCGEAASEPDLIPLLVALGLDEFSVNPTKILETRYIINKSKIDSKIFEKAMNLRDVEEVRKFLKYN